MENRESSLSIWDSERKNPLSPVSVGLKYLKWMPTRNYSEKTIIHYRYTLAHFLRWCDQQEIASIEEITPSLLERYQTYLLGCISPKTKQLLSIESRHRYMQVVCNFSRWLAKKGYLSSNPTENIELPKLPRKIPSHVLNPSEVEQIVNNINLETPMGLRDRAIIEVLYSTGIRREELQKLTLADIDFEKGTLLVIEGKGKKDRVVPIGERALKWLKKYLVQSRPHLLRTSKEDILFITKQGGPFTCPNSITKQVTSHIKAANIKKKGGCHLFRHAMATSMLENGANIRYIQEILGHSKLNTTEIYTRVSIHKLKEVHQLTHPANEQNSEIQIQNAVNFQKPEPRPAPQRKGLQYSSFWKREPAKINDFIDLGKKFLQSLEIKGYSEITIRENSYFLQYFVQWSNHRNIFSPNEVTISIIEQYQRYVNQLKSQKTDLPLSSSARNSRLITLILFFRWLKDNCFISNNPALEIELPKTSRHLPHQVLTIDEVQRIFQQPSLDNPEGIRDRAILELFYSTGIRRTELSRLSVEDVDFQKSTLIIRECKNKNNRYVPVGKSALDWIETYLHYIRPLLIFTNQNHNNALFLNRVGRPISPTCLTLLVSHYIKAANVPKTGSCHLFRHAMATHMLENGADIRYIQEMLGHNQLSTTNIYTKVSIAKLKEIHTKSHPAKIEPSKTPEILAEIENSES